MRNDFFKFPKGTLVEFLLSRNRLFGNLCLEGKISYYFQKTGWQTVKQGTQVKNYPVSLVHIHTNDGKEFTIDVDCVKTKPTQAMVDEVNGRAEKAVVAKKKPIERQQRRYGAPPFKMADAIGKAFAQTYIASKNSKKFHAIGSPTAKRIANKNAVKFFTKDAAEKSGRTYAGK